MKTYYEMLGYLNATLNEWPNAETVIQKTITISGKSTGWRWVVENDMVFAEMIEGSNHINKASFEHHRAEVKAGKILTVLPTEHSATDAPMPAAPPATAPPATLSRAKDWLVENIGGWPVEVDIINPQAAPHGWRWSLSTDNGEPEVICTHSTDGTHITEDEWQEARPMIEPVVGQWYEIDNSAYQVNYVGAELVVVADVDGGEEVIGLDGFKGAAPCERPRTQRELILDEFNEWWFATHPDAACQPLTMGDVDGSTHTKLSYLIDFIIDREGE